MAKKQGGALKGIRILEPAQHLSIPLATKLLSDMGAEVIHVESQPRPDGSRMDIVPENRPQPGFWNHAGRHSELNRNKRGITIDLNKSEGKEMFLELVKISDVVAENYTPRVMKGLGLDYAALKKVKPNLIMISSTGFGHTGPYADYVSVGWSLETMCGLTSITGYPDRPARSRLPYPDYPVGVAAAFAILAALRYRERTGRGQWIDLSQYETMASTVPQAFTEYAKSGSVPDRMGNRHPSMAPHGCYRCKGNDHWLAITISKEDEWQAFCRVMRKENLVCDPRFGTMAERLDHQDELDTIIGNWTINMDKMEAMHLLQKAGVPAGAVLNAKELMTDPHLKSRNFYAAVEHTTPWEGHKVVRPYPDAAWKMSRTEVGHKSGAPSLGQHNEYVFKELLKKTDADIERLRNEGVIGDTPKSFSIIPPTSLDELLEQGLIREYDKEYLDILGKALEMQLS